MFRYSLLSLLNITSVTTPPVVNEPYLHFHPGSVEATKLSDACSKIREVVHKIPVVINGKRYYPRNPMELTIPSNNKTLFTHVYRADEKLLKSAREASLNAHKMWSTSSFQFRAAIALRAANLLSNSDWRWKVGAATMIGQSKTPWQSEIDAVAETCDFLRFNTKFASELFSKQPTSPNHSQIWNMVEYRPLEGFITSITPFNFTAIGLNLAFTPAMMGNTVLWKPSENSILANYYTFCLLEEAGLPPGVINFVPCGTNEVENVLKDKDLAGVAFTGSTATFQKIWTNIGSNISNYKNFPRINGETGGKNFHLVHPSAHIPTVIATTVRSAFEYQGQKCSACSRLFVPKSKWKEIKTGFIEACKSLKQGQPDDFSSFLSALINERGYKKVVNYIETMKKEKCEIICGGGYSSEKGWFVEPTIGVTTNLSATTLREEIFGPVLTVYVYDDGKPGYWAEVCKNVDSGAKYALTGSLFVTDRVALEEAAGILRYASGMLYINDKCTGYIVGQQPFGGGRHSGTNEKSGGSDFIKTWISCRSIKETFSYLPQISYPHQLPDILTAPMI